eukprot:scaffold4501_cov395-Prasinococcus_capsulatus_cf.AAC.13
MPPSVPTESTGTLARHTAPGIPPRNHSNGCLARCRHQLKVLDARHCTTNQQMFEACCRHLEHVLEAGVTEAVLTCFRPSPAGARVWNNQLMGFAGYVKQGKVVRS